MSEKLNLFPNQACPVGVQAVLFPSSREVKKLAFLGGIAEESRLDCMAGARHAMAHGPWPMAQGPWPRAHGPWPMAHGPGPMAHGPGPMAHGPGPMAQGPWPDPKIHYIFSILA